MPGIGDYLHESAGGIEGVVEAVVAVAEKHAAAHLVGQLGLGLFILALMMEWSST